MTKQFADLKWGQGKSGEKIANVFLFPGEALTMEDGTVLLGPAHITIVRTGKLVKPKVYRNPLPKTVFDLDNPLEYPCKSCGAPRHAHCVGNNEACVYRVFHIAGGIL